MFNHDKARLILFLGSFFLLGLYFSNQCVAALPSWVTSPPQASADGRMINVVGVGTGQMLEEAQQIAVLNAARRVVEFLGLSIEESGSLVRTEVEHRLREELKYSTDRFPLKGGFIKEWYFREVAGQYEAFVLVRYPKKEIEEAQQKFQAEQIDQMNRSRLMKQRRSQVRLVILIEESNMGTVSADSIVGEALSEALMKAGFSVVAEHEIGRTNLERLQEAMKKERFFPLQPALYHQVKYVVTGRVSTHKGSENPVSALSSHADLFIKIINLETGEVVAQSNLVGVRGFGDSLELAGIEALKVAGHQTAETLINQMTSREEETNGNP